MAAAGNVGVGCRASNVVGLDLDRHPGLPDGVGRFHTLCDRYAGGPDSDGWPDTLTVVTSSGFGGQHLYFRAASLLILSVSGGCSPLGPGIDIRTARPAQRRHLVGPVRSSTDGRTPSSGRCRSRRCPAGSLVSALGHPQLGTGPDTRNSKWDGAEAPSHLRGTLTPRPQRRPQRDTPPPLPQDRGKVLVIVRHSGPCAPAGYTAPAWGEPTQRNGLSAANGPLPVHACADGDIGRH
jgi:hypothetical protein